MIADTLVLSPGGLTPRNTDAAFGPGPDQTGVPFAKAEYAYDRLDVTRLTKIRGGFTWILRFEAQAASSNLLPSEQLNVGGMDTVRGYEEDVAGGPDGILASTEIRGPPVSPLAAWGSAGPARDQLQPDVFVDYAHVFNVHAIPGAPSSIDLASAGLGARYQVGSRLIMRAECGFPFDAPPGVRRRAEFANIEVTLSL